MRRARTRRVPQRDGMAKGIGNGADGAMRRKETIGADFVRIELDLADTFCKLAIDSRSAERKRVHEINAHRALDTALHSLTKLHLQSDEAEEFVTKIEEVKALLETVEANGNVGSKC